MNGSKALIALTLALLLPGCNGETAYQVDTKPDLWPCLDHLQEWPDGSSYLTTCSCRWEAPAMLGDITEAVLNAFEARGSLCAGAENSVPPGGIVSGRKYKPSRNTGSDFYIGNEDTGWVCLGYTHDTPIGCTYSYNVGSGYYGPEFGGPDPGPNGFEVAARGEWDGDLRVSVFTITGSVDPQTGALVLAPPFVRDPKE